MMRWGSMAAACAAALMLAGCAGTTVEGLAHRPGRVVQAEFLGATAAPQGTAVQFLNARDGWVGLETLVPATGAVLLGSTVLMRTTDGGVSWTRAAKVPGSILAIDFLSARHGFIVVQAGGALRLLVTSDGGTAFRTLSQPKGDASAVELRFASPSRGFLVVGGDMDVTTDGGRTWQSRAIALPAAGSGAAPALQVAPYFLSAKDGFVAQYGAVYRTRDGGRSWQAVYQLPAALASSGGGQAAGPTTFVGTETGYVIMGIPNCWAGGCPDVVLRTGDGGATWQPVSYEMQGTLPGIDAPPGGPPGGSTALVGWGREGVAAATMRGLFVSRDGGVHWLPAGRGETAFATVYTVLATAPGGGALATGNAYLVRVPVAGPLQALWPAPAPAEMDSFGARDGIGLELQPVPEILATSDGGRTWRPMAVPVLPKGGAAPTDIAFADRRHGWAFFAFVGYAELYATADGGRRWHALDIGSASYPQLFSGRQGLVLTEGADAPSLLVTSDGGGHFQTRPLPKGFPTYGMIAFASPALGYAADQQRLWETADGGRSWHPIALPQVAKQPYEITELAVDRQGDLWLRLTLQGPKQPERIDVRSTTGGWRQISLPPVISGSSYLQSLDALSARAARLLTPAGIFETKDGGRVWRNITWPRSLDRLGKSSGQVRGRRHRRGT